MTGNDWPCAPRRWKRIRLGPALYAKAGAICSVTVTTLHRRPVFADGPVARSAVDVLRAHAEQTGVPIYVYCIMPDHRHVVRGPSPSCDSITFIGQFKNLAQRAAWRLGVTGRVWQQGFFDHFLRIEEDLREVVRYVQGNPVRAGLVGDPGQ